MNLKFKKKLFFYFCYLLLILIIVEFFSYIFYKFAIKDIRSKPELIFNNLTIKDDNLLGWTHGRGDSPKPSMKFLEDYSKNEACIYVFGDSFSQSDEVLDKDAWSNLLEQKINCPVANFAIGGYGTDQSYLRMSKLLPNRSSYSDKKETNIVFFGVYVEMLRRNVSASYLFYGNTDNKKSLRPYFILSDHKNLILRNIPNEFDKETLKHFHEFDRYYKAYKINFPYSISIIKNLYYRVNKIAFDKLVLENPRGRAYDEEEVAELQLKLMEAAEKLAIERGFEIKFVFFPTPDNSKSNTRPYNNFLKNIEKNKIIDLFPYLQVASKNEKNLKAPFAHYNELGNKYIADALFREIIGTINMKN